MQCVWQYPPHIPSLSTYLPSECVTDERTLSTMKNSRLNECSLKYFHQVNRSTREGAVWPHTHPSIHQAGSPHHGGHAHAINALRSMGLPRTSHKSHVDKASHVSHQHTSTTGTTHTRNQCLDTPTSRHPFPFRTPHTLAHYIPRRTPTHRHTEGAAHALPLTRRREGSVAGRINRPDEVHEELSPHGPASHIAEEAAFGFLELESLLAHHLSIDVEVLLHLIPDLLEPGRRARKPGDRPAINGLAPEAEWNSIAPLGDDIWLLDGEHEAFAGHVEKFAPIPCGSGGRAAGRR
mmetsp:Transcript_23497/g.67518  ORF Transcript_23497/g.67518 Transcript_23497/m.67518 type:complete len:293 (+) Transcript_23497:314-1192(+)